MSKAAELANLIGNINAGGGGVNRNFIINGAMNVSQRGTSFSFSNNVYCLDRIMTSLGNNDGAATVTQDSSAPEGFANSLKVNVTTADDSLAVNHYNQMVYRIEAQNLQSLAFGTSDAKNITLSFYVKSNKTGTYSVNIAQNDNSYKQANLTYTIDSANTWERKSLTFTGDTSGVINDDNGHGLEIVWILAAGTTYSSGNNSASFVTYADANYAANQGVNVFDTVGNTWFLTGMQLEIGQNPTSFEHEPFEKTLHKCERYFCKTFEYAQAVTTNPSTKTNTIAGPAASDSAYDNICQWWFTQSLRGAPTVTFFNPYFDNANWAKSGSNGPTAALYSSGKTEVAVRDNSGGAGGTNLQIHATADAEL